MKTMRFWVTLSAMALVAIGILVASNQGFHLTRALLGPVDSASGTNWVGLPYRTHPDLQTAADLFDSLGGAANVTSVARFDPVTGDFEVYGGVPQDDFTLTAGEGIRIEMKTTMDYAIFGSHDPTQVITLLGPAGSVDGTRWYSHPYNGDATTAAELQNEIGAQSVTTIWRFLPESDGLVKYTGAMTDVDFTLVAGEAYKLQMNSTLEFVPKTLP